MRPPRAGVATAFESHYGASAPLPPGPFSARLRLRCVRSTFARAVLVGVCFLPVGPVVRGQSADDDERHSLATDFAQAYRDRDWSRAIQVGRELVEIAPKNDIHAYNLACVYALNGDIDSAGTWLAKAAERGFRHLKRFETDADLVGVRKNTAYATALALVKANQEKAFARLDKKFLKHPPLVVLPSGYDKNVASPLVIALHGYGCRADMMTREWKGMADRIGAILVAPQGVYKVKGGSGYSWFGPGTVDYDEADHLVRLTLDLVMKEYEIDKNRLILTGFSQGGYVAYVVSARQPYLFPAVIPMGAGYVAAIDAPERATGSSRPRYYFMIGEHDQSVDQIHDAVEAFKRAGYAVKKRIYPGVGHAFPKNMVQEIHDALDFVLDHR